VVIYIYIATIIENDFSKKYGIKAIPGIFRSANDLPINLQFFISDGPSLGGGTLI
jgi:hypothetical protein